jgi:murein DD-endopeptidase MepM/ murein hydrolase activator NlpD
MTYPAIALPSTTFARRAFVGLALAATAVASLVTPAWAGEAFSSAAADSLLYDFPRVEEWLAAVWTAAPTPQPKLDPAEVVKGSAVAGAATATGAPPVRLVAPQAPPAPPALQASKPQTPLAKLLQKGILDLQWPARGEITTYFGEVGDTSPRGHAGLDIAAPAGTPVLAAFEGKVVRSGWGDAYGNLVVIEHAGGYETWYGHLDTLGVSEGQVVSHGARVGTVGSTGYSTGPHLHFELRLNHELRNPMRYLAP